jgi:GMP synthase (glutamine-hydrolysing)
MNTLIVDSNRKNREEELGRYCKLISLFSKYEVVRDENISEDFDVNDFDAIILTGSSSRVVKGEYFDGYMKFLKMVTKENIAVFGICYGHEILAKIFGGKVGEAGRFIKKRYDKEPEVIHILDEDNIFSGMGTEIKVAESHYDQVLKEELDKAGFKILANSDDCEVEAIKHKEKTIYGTQFHPERSSEVGRKIMENFYEHI